MCICPTNFGGPGCNINIQRPPDFILSETCCDVRKYNCEKISGYGYPFARKTKLHYKIISTEVFNYFIVFLFSNMKGIFFSN